MTADNEGSQSVYERVEPPLSSEVFGGYSGR